MPHVIDSTSLISHLYHHTIIQLMRPLGCSCQGKSLLPQKCKFLFLAPFLSLISRVGWGVPRTTQRNFLNIFMAFLSLNHTIHYDPFDTLLRPPNRINFCSSACNGFDFPVLGGPMYSLLWQLVTSSPPGSPQKATCHSQSSCSGSCSRSRCGCC